MRTATFALPGLPVNAVTALNTPTVSGWVPASVMSRGTVSVVVSGAVGVTGSLQMLGSNDQIQTLNSALPAFTPPTPFPLDDAPIAVSGNGTYTVGLDEFACKWLALQWTPTAGTVGTGSISAQITLRGDS